jgi:hypothetical protein
VREEDCLVILVLVAIAFFTAASFTVVFFCIEKRLESETARGISLRCGGSSNVRYLMKCSVRRRRLAR